MKKILCLLLALSMLVLCGCGGSTEEPAPTEPAVEETQPVEQVTEPAAQVTEAPAEEPVTP